MKDKLKSFFGRIRRLSEDLKPTEEDRKHEKDLEKLRIEKGQVFNWNEFFIPMFKYIGAGLVISIFLIGIFALALSNILSSVSQSLITGKTDFNVGGAFDIDIEGDFQGYYTTKTERVLRKVNLTCTDEYEYGSLTYITPITNWVWEKLETLKDSGMIEYHREDVTPAWVKIPALQPELRNETWVEILYKIPKNNCAKEVIERHFAGDYIPTKIGITKIKATGNLSGGGESSLLPLIQKFLEKYREKIPYNLYPTKDFDKVERGNKQYA